MSQRSHTRLISGGGRHRRGKAAAAVVLTPFLDHSVTLASTGAANSVRFPSPLWGGDRGGGLCWRTRVDEQQRPPSPTLPHKGGGSRPVVLRRCASTSLDDRFHETGRHGTGDSFVDSSFVSDRTRSGIMARWRQAVELALTDEEIDRLTA